MKREFIPGEDFDAYDVQLMEEMYKRRLSGIPIAFTLLDMRKTETHCHETADMLVLLLEDSNRVTANLPNIIGKDKSHSWVECGEYCYDTTEGMKWKKSSYYEANKPTNIVIHPREESLQKMKSHLDLPESSKEKYVAFVRDLEENISSQLYRSFLRFYIGRFKKEKNLDIEDYDEQVVEKYLKNLQNFYNTTRDRVLRESESYSGEEPEDK